MNYNKIILIALLLSVSLLSSCSSSTENSQNSIPAAKPVVSITAISHGEMYLTKEFNVYSQYLKKETIRAPISGYVQKIQTAPGGRVQNGEVLAVLQTQEARALANANLKNDSLVGFEGVIKVRSPKLGIVNTINYQEGAFVQQGEQLMEVVAMSSIVFIMNVPYENINDIRTGAKTIINLPGDRKIRATVGNPLPIVTTSSQVQSFILRPDSLFYIPENLNAVSEIIVGKHQNIQRLAKKALMTNETQTNYWVMKMLNDSIAVKVDVVKGMETKDLVEIKSPDFKLTDRILLEGQYGLPDSASVKIISPG